MTIRNPWRDLPNSDPYVLPDDRPFVETFNRSATENTYIHTELLPEPFLGRLAAPVVVLLLNPGFSEDDNKFHAQPEFCSRLRKAIRAENEFSTHFHLDRAAGGPGCDWWLRSAGPLIQEVGRECVADNLLAIEYFPYHSRKFGHAHRRLPSQEFSFSLVRSAIAREAEIICVRGANVWFGAVPELASYSRLSQVHNPRSASLSAKNLASFSSVVAALRAIATPTPAVERDAPQAGVRRGAWGQ